MKFIRIKAIAKKEALQVLRDPFSLAMAFLVPLFLLTIFGYAITFDIREIDTVILDRDGSSRSRELTAELRQAVYDLRSHAAQAGVECAEEAHRAAAEKRDIEEV